LARPAIREQHNAEQGLPLAENFLLDLRYAFRMLYRSPGFSLIAIATMALGVGATTAIYSVIDATFLVNEQSREIAIRLAVGAQRRDILKMVLRQGLTLAAAGAGVGLVGALIVSHLMAGLLYGVSPYDLSTFAGVTAVLTAVAIAASYVPALRAMRLDPITTLHSEERLKPTTM
jgi:ABC-type antimicrobial peptide transport system permease subunit